jgi:GT2 family glycosyltransferase
MTFDNKQGMKYLITGSIVTFHNNKKVLAEAMASFLNTSLNVKLYIIDNSADDSIRSLCTDQRCEYVHMGKNVGFGTAHNVAMRRAVDESNYHLVLNPDIYFGPNILEKIVEYMDSHPEAGQLMPKIHYPSGEVQHLCKLLPTPVDLFLRRFFPWWPGAEKRNRKYELLDSGYNKIMNIPYLSGCFMFLRTSVIKEIGYFDERIFMYIEDCDLTRRIHGRYQTIFYPDVQVVHHYTKGSYKNLRLMLYNIHGAIIYFSKYGWIFDEERKKINHRVLNAYVPHS